MNEGRTKGSLNLEKNEYCKFYFLSHGDCTRQKTKLPKKSRKTQFTENPRKSTVLLRMVHAQGATKLSTMRKQKSVQVSACGAQDTHFVCFLTLLFSFLKKLHVFTNVLQKKFRQAPQDTLFLMIEFKSLSIPQN